jgi:hypothetical protein
MVTNPEGVERRRFDPPTHYELQFGVWITRFNTHEERAEAIAALYRDHKRQQQVDEDAKRYADELQTDEERRNAILDGSYIGWKNLSQAEEDEEEAATPARTSGRRPGISPKGSVEAKMRRVNRNKKRWSQTPEGQRWRKMRLKSQKDPQGRSPEWWDANTPRNVNMKRGRDGLTAREEDMD